MKVEYSAGFKVKRAAKTSSPYCEGKKKEKKKNSGKHTLFFENITNILIISYRNMQIS